MKFVLLILVIVAVIWFLRAGRGPAPRAPHRGATGDAPHDMVECPVCLVHLPRTEALPGPDGRLYCCAEHLRAQR